MLLTYKAIIGGVNMIAVKNLKKSGRNFPSPICKCETWIAHWDINKYPDGKKVAGWCRGCGKKIDHSKLCGGHVIKVNSMDECKYIIPLCSSCNGKDDVSFEVEESDLVSANCSKCVSEGDSVEE